MNSLSYDTWRRLEKERRIIHKNRHILLEIERHKRIIHAHEQRNQVEKRIAKYNQNQTLEG